VHEHGALSSRPYAGNERVSLAQQATRAFLLAHPGEVLAADRPIAGRQYG
jgi:hypothetical protein